MDVISELLTMLSPALVDRIAAATGISPELARKAMSVALPAILAALGSKAASESGAKDLFKAVGSADVEVGDTLAGALGGPRRESVVEQGSNVLRSLLGGNALSDLTGALDKTTPGIGPRAASTVTALAGQLALSGLAKNSVGMDAAGFSRMLASQQENIKAAVPSDLGRLLSGAGVVGGGYADSARKATADVSRAAASASKHVKETAKSSTNWLLWLIPLVIVAAIALYFLFNKSEQTMQTSTQTPPAATELVVDGVDVGKQLTTALDGVKSSLGGITDAATAQAALPKLQEATAAIDSISGTVGKLSAEQKTLLATLINAALPAIKEMANKTLAVAGVGDVAKPVVDALMAKLEALAKPA